MGKQSIYNDLPMANGLTLQERRFVLAFTQSFNIRKAAIDTGINPKFAKRMGKEIANREHVVNAIVQRMNRLQKASDIDTAYVIKGMSDVYESALEAGDYQNAMVALEKLATIFGLDNQAPKVTEKVQNNTLVISENPDIAPLLADLREATGLSKPTPAPLENRAPHVAASQKRVEASSGDYQAYHPNKVIDVSPIDVLPDDPVLSAVTVFDDIFDGDGE